eukprot:Nitzschia sp. Nitz4//scaffold173_size47512//16650//17897//NITZ4_007156-RA/size47512-processed-gene-0.35-mRNA-1//-1//CDS//3329538796//6215//frame0
MLRVVRDSRNAVAYILLVAMALGRWHSCNAFAQLIPGFGLGGSFRRGVVGAPPQKSTSFVGRSQETHLTASIPRWKSHLFLTKRDASNDNVTTSDLLSLDSIRDTLVRQEETIIFALIERAQYRQNPTVYQKGGLGHLGTPPGTKPSPDDSELNFLEWMLTGTEALHYAVRRYTSPEEHAFFPNRLPTEKVLDELDYPDDLLSSEGGASDLNFNPILLQKYVDVIVPGIAVQGDDEQHGSTVLADIAVLQALSRRVHYGKFVAESKYLSDPEGYTRLVKARDAKGVMKLLTNDAVEAQVLRRAKLKAATYGQEPLLTELPPLKSSTTDTSLVAAAAASAVVAALESLGDHSRTGSKKNKVCPGSVESIYRDIIIPLTKDVELAYLFRRCGEEPPPNVGPDRMSTDVTKLSPTTPC